MVPLQALVLDVPAVLSVLLLVLLALNSSPSMLLVGRPALVLGLPLRVALPAAAGLCW